MRRKLAMLSVAVLLFTMAWTEGGALSLNGFTSVALGNGGPTHDNVIFQIRDQVDQITANGSFYRVGDISVWNLDEDFWNEGYSYRLVKLEVTSNGFSVEDTQCGDADFRIRNTESQAADDIFEGLSINLPFNSLVITDYDFELSISPTNTEVDCIWSGGIVRATIAEVPLPQ